jgi:hypothetical protein
MMKTRQIICAAMFLGLVVGVSWAQGDTSQQPADNAQQPADNTQQPGATPAAVAFGQNNPPAAPADNPPITGLDQPALEPGLTGRSFLIPGVHVNQSVDSNVDDSTGSAAVSGVTRALGSLTLERLWKSYQVALDYVGGAAFYSNRANNVSQIHTLGVDDRVLWRTGQLAIRDSFSYLPEGTFGSGAYGGSGALGGTGLGGIGGGGLGGGIGSGGQGGFFGPGQFASLGQQPRISNVALADITESLSPRTSITAAGSYGLVHFTDNTLGFINSKQISAQAGFNYQLNRKDQLGLLYGFQAFRYPSTIGSNFDTHVVHVLYGHRITGRMDLVLGAGPQLTIINNGAAGSTQRLSLSGRASLRYRFSTANVGLYYDHYNSSGSGFFAGATSDVARASATRPFGRLWNATFDLGFTHNSKLLPSVFGVGAQTYNYLYAGGSLRRQLGEYFSAFVSYQFNNLAFDQSFCGTSTSCNRTSQRQVATFGLDWHPHPIRLD